VFCFISVYKLKNKYQLKSFITGKQTVMKRKIISFILFTALYAILSTGCVPPRHLAQPPPPGH
jgi:hypothetical protein